MAGHGPEGTPGVILMVENIWIKNREIYQLLLTRPSVCFFVSNVYNLKATINWSQEIQNPDKFFNVILKISTSWTWILLHSLAFLYSPPPQTPYAILYTQEVSVLALSATDLKYLQILVLICRAEILGDIIWKRCSWCKIRVFTIFTMEGRGERELCLCSRDCL